MTLGIDDYPCAGACMDCGCGATPLFAARECTSFAAWRLRNDLGHPNFPFGQQGWDNADSWASAAAANGIAQDVNGGAVRGDLADFPNLGPSGHVGVVLSVQSGGVVIEDYNWGFTGRYHQHFVGYGSNGGIHFLHMGSVAPVPTPVPVPVPTPTPTPTPTPGPSPPPPRSDSMLLGIGLVGLGGFLAYHEARRRGVGLEVAQRGQGGFGGGRLVVVRGAPPPDRRLVTPGRAFGSRR